MNPLRTGVVHQGKCASHQLPFETNRSVNDSSAPWLEFKRYSTYEKCSDFKKTKKKNQTNAASIIISISELFGNTNGAEV